MAEQKTPEFITKQEETIELFDLNLALKGASDVPNMFEEERLAAEKIRAAAEHREPDLENPPVSVGTALGTADTLLRSPEANRGNQLPSLTALPEATSPVAEIPVVVEVETPKGEDYAVESAKPADNTDTEDLL